MPATRFFARCALQTAEFDQLREDLSVGAKAQRVMKMQRRLVAAPPRPSGEGDSISFDRRSVSRPELGRAHQKALATVRRLSDCSPWLM